MSKETAQGPSQGGPFRLLKYFVISGFAVIAIVTFLLGAFLYTRMVNTLLTGAEDDAKLLAENLNYNVYNWFYAPLKERGAPLDLSKWDQFGALDGLIKDLTYGLKITRIKIIDARRKIVYSTDYDLINSTEPAATPYDQALNGRHSTIIRQKSDSPGFLHSEHLVETYYPLRELTGNYWMLGKIYGVIQISQDVTDQYASVQRSVVAIIVVAVGLMAFLFVALTLIVRRGEKILLDRADEQKRLEKQLQQSEKMASIGQMVATIAHEIRNPLGIIRSSAEMLSRKAATDSDKAQRLSGVIVEESTRLSAILTDFLDFARPRSPNLKPTDLSGVVERVRTNLGQEIEERAVLWSEEHENGFRPIAMADGDLLYQAFLNITMNAFEAMGEGGAFSVAYARRESRVIVEFRDTGPGIGPQDISKVFTPFYTSHEMGTGLGLSVVLNIISAHDGEITVESEEGEGAVFRVSLPIGDPEHREPPRARGAEHN